MASIYNIQPHAVGNPYKKHDIVEQSAGSGEFWYALQGHTSTAADTPDTGASYASLWGGFIHVSKTNSEEPHFIWEPDYNLQTTTAPKIQSVQFGDGYEQRLTDGINNDLLKLTISFNGRNEKEATAISHFLSARKGKDPFYFRVPEPFDATKKMICRSWSSTLIFHDNFNISGQFEEVS